MSKNEPESKSQQNDRDSGIDATIESGDALHAHSAGDDDFLVETRSAGKSSDVLADTIGTYRILSQLGEGGMGVVYLAEQREPVQRRVALKVIKAGMDTGQVIARFEAERQALAMMDHASIAKVYDAGATESGRPYFVMELVKGTPITKFCDQQKLEINERLALFTKVCSAIQHAHNKGIIHRDLKPSNILVSRQEDEFVPKVIDFGLAKATNQKLTEKTMFTAQGQVVGTLEYMSPEQAELNEHDVDTRTDIYSLGVVLYELLAGSTPLKRDSLREVGFVEILKRIKEEEPVRPSSRIHESTETIDSISKVRKSEPRRLISQIRGDLDWIVLKAMDKERSRRYETANGLSKDVERYLNNEPIVARPASMAYRIRKTIQRNKAAMVSLALIAISMVVGTGIATWQAIRATRAERISEARRVQTREALDSMSSLVISELISEQTEVTPGIRKLLDDSLRMYEEFADENEGDAQSRVGVAAAHYRVAKIQSFLGIDDRGLNSFKKARELYRILADDEPTNSHFLSQLIEMELQIGEVYFSDGNYDQAESEWEQSKKTLEQYGERFGKSLEYLGQESTVLYKMASVYMETARQETATNELENAIAIQRKLVDSSDDPLDAKGRRWRGVLASMLQKLGLILRRSGDNNGAIGNYQEAIAILQKLETEKPLDSEQLLRLGVLINDVGVVYYHDRDFEKAGKFYREAREIRARAAIRFPNDILQSACLGATLLNLGNLHRMQNLHFEADPQYVEAIKTLERVRSRDPKHAWSNNLLQASYRCRVESLIQLKRFDDALENLDQLETVVNERWPDAPVLPPHSQLRRAFILARQDQRDQAIKIVDQVNEGARTHGDELDLAEAAYYSAAVYSVTTGANAEDRQRAIEYLSAALENAFDSCPVKEVHFVDDPDFQSLYQLEGFKRLAAENK